MVEGPSSSSDPASSPAGWYPTSPGWQGYWDGEHWTGHQAPLPAQPAQSGMDDNNLALLVHLGGALFGIIVPIIVFAIKKDQSAYVRHHSLEALNFHLTVIIASFASFVLILAVIGIFLLIAVLIGFWVFSIVAAIAASQGEWYRYPMTIRMIT